MLRKWHSPSAASFLAEEVIDDISEGDDVILWDGSEDDNKHPVINPKLENTRRKELDIYTPTRIQRCFE